MSPVPTASLRRAALWVLAGLTVQLGCSLHWTPLTFVLFVALGVPPVLLGVALYLRTVWRVLGERKAL